MEKFEIEKGVGFDIRHILECGQIFRYEIYNDYSVIFSAGHIAFVLEYNGKYAVYCDDTLYFRSFFDIDTDYTVIIDRLISLGISRNATQFGSGIRILRQNLFEVIISFIISANNNISRIQKSITNICRSAGQSRTVHLPKEVADRVGMSEYEFYAFPTISQFLGVAEDTLTDAGVGYRAKYIEATVSKIAESSLLSDLPQMSTAKARSELIKLAGVGPKVADCILLFGLYRMDTFPVDTWIAQYFGEKVEYSGLDRVALSQALVYKYRDYSGYAQQYLFYYKRSFLKKGEEI